MSSLLGEFKRRPIQTAVASALYVGGAVYLLLVNGMVWFFWWAATLSPMPLAAAALSAKTFPLRLVFSIAAVGAMLGLGFFVSWAIPAYYCVGAALIALWGFAAVRVARHKMRKLDR